MREHNVVEVEERVKASVGVRVLCYTAGSSFISFKQSQYCYRAKYGKASRAGNFITREKVIKFDRWNACSNYITYLKTLCSV